MDIVSDSLVLIEDRLNKLLKKPDLAGGTRTSYNFSNGETFTPRPTSQKRNKPRSFVHSERYSSLNPYPKQLRLNSLLQAAHTDIPRSMSMVLLSLSPFLYDLAPSRIGLAPSLGGLAPSLSKNFTLTRSPSMDNAWSKRRELAASIRKSKFDTPTNIDISALHAKHPTLPHRNSLSRNRYQKGSKNIVTSEFSLLSVTGRGSDNHSCRTYSIGNNSFHSTRASDATLTSNISSLSNDNINLSESNTPETSLSASEIADSVAKAKGLESSLDSRAGQQETAKLATLDPLEESSVFSSRRSSFSSAVEYVEDKQTNVSSVEANLIEEEGARKDYRNLKDLSVLSCGPSLVKSSSSSVSADTEPEAETRSNESQSGATSQDCRFEETAPATSSAPSTPLQKSSDRLGTGRQIDRLSPEYHHNNQRGPSSTPQDLGDEALLSTDLKSNATVEYESDCTITKLESLTRTATSSSKPQGDQNLVTEDENSAEVLAMRRSSSLLTQRRNRGLMLQLDGTRQSIVELPTSVLASNLLDSGTSVLKFANSKKIGFVMASPNALQTKLRRLGPVPTAKDFSDGTLINRLPSLGVVNVDFDKFLPTSPHMENTEKKRTQEAFKKASPEKPNLSDTALLEKPAKSKPCLYKMLKFFSKRASKQETTTRGFFGAVKLNYRFSPTKRVIEPPAKDDNAKTLETSRPESPNYDLPSVEFGDLFFKDVSAKFEEVEQQVYNEIEVLREKNSIHNLFLKDDELSKDQIAYQRQKDARKSDEYISMVHRSDLAGEAPSEKLVASLPVGSEQVVVLQKQEIAAILDNPTGIAYLFLRFVKQYKDSLEVTVRLTGFDPTEAKQIGCTAKQTSILGKSKSRAQKKVKFDNILHVSETYDPEMYNRYNRSVTQYYLTEYAEVNRIKKDLNYYKYHEMLVHAGSQCNTHFFY